MLIDKKFCKKCQLYLDVSSFKKVTTESALKKYPDGYYWCCKECFRRLEWTYTPENEPNNRKLRRRSKRLRKMTTLERLYGLTEQQYSEKIREQNNLCAICGKKDAGRVLCVDHDHATGLVRGLLCTNCNLGLGNLKDDIQIFQSAIAYLKKYGKR